jgi:AraC family transcriptional regulator of adaptative response/methylated-DNA-[protein]-cysteine methyltransferase
MYKAVVSRDSSFEGVFLVGVKTTGIFCRPTCGAKKPRRENVEFFRSADDALYAGYRPCNRCKPINQLKEPPPAVKRLRELVEKSPSRRITGRDLRRLGIDPSTARRQFHKYHGMTFHAYQRARRMGMALREVRSGESVIGAQLNQGFESASGFWDAFRRVFGSPPSKSGQVRCLLARWIDTPLGAMLAVADDEGLRMLEFVDRRALEREMKALMRRTKSVVVPGDNEHLQAIADELREYFEGKRTSFTIPLKPLGSDFDRKVWSMLQRIRPSETWSYGTLAQRVGHPAAHRAVAQANGRNSLAIVVPCHRVIRADGSLSGYGGGVWRKQWLLEHEKRMVLRRNAS